MTLLKKVVFITGLLYVESSLIMNLDEFINGLNFKNLCSEAFMTYPDTADIRHDMNRNVLIY